MLSWMPVLTNHVHGAVWDVMIKRRQPCSVLVGQIGQIEIGDLLCFGWLGVQRGEVMGNRLARIFHTPERRVRARGLQER